MVVRLLDRWYERYNVALACASAFCLPLKLIFAYCFLIPLIILWLVRYRSELGSIVRETAWLSIPFLLFVLSIFLSSLFGMNPTRSLSGVPRLLFFGCAMLAFRAAAAHNGDWRPGYRRHPLGL